MDPRARELIAFKRARRSPRASSRPRREPRRITGFAGMIPMALTIEPRAGYLRVFVRKRATGEAPANVQAILAAIEEHKASRVLIVVTESDPIFKVEQYDLSGALGRIAKLADLRIALVSDSSELFASHQYVELLAAHKGIVVKAFRDEKAARHWLQL